MWSNAVRLAAADLNHRVDVPYSVVIGEYVELTKTGRRMHLSAQRCADRLAQDVRTIEVAANRSVLSMLGEFEFIDAIVAGLGDRAAGDWITLGPRTMQPSSQPRPFPKLPLSTPCCQICVFLPRRHSSLVAVHL